MQTQNNYIVRGYEEFHVQKDYNMYTGREDPSLLINILLK